MAGIFVYQINATPYTGKMLLGIGKWQKGYAEMVRTTNLSAFSK